MLLKQQNAMKYEKLQKQGKVVAIARDGINDAPQLLKGCG